MMPAMLCRWGRMQLLCRTTVDGSWTGPCRRSALPSIVDAVGDKIEVHMDSGIRSGQDVLKALSLGAKGTYIGRAFVNGLGAMGETGVTKALDVVQKELITTMGLVGERQVADLGRHNLLIPNGFEGDWVA